ncbi:MAG: carbamoyl-phosphate synthase large subunit [Chloroflexia bacterium]|nr:carbamoyl-phosphate synthase large subunit [Chloroflexia bacterium]
MSEAIRRVLVIGSGPIVIGQAAEFDYAGTQACRALREEGIETVLVNSNPATIMTDENIADVVYIEPLTVEVIRRIIIRERPDGLLPTLGGQTGLNLAVQLAEAGILDEYGVKLLGTSLRSIQRAEDRELFRDMLQSINQPVLESAIVHTLEEAHAFANENSLPLIVRPAYTLGGTGGGIATTPQELDEIVRSGIQASPIRQVLVERSVLGWKEIEYEVIRDGADNVITVCNMENLDPMGVHTGDSIVVAPSQTLSDREYQMLRSASIAIIRELGIEGGCNVQLALDPYSMQYYVIEVNPRVSRSSALASKATGYPIARVAAKIAIGKRLDEIPNAVTRETTAAFEPALDYCVVKIPRWPFDKFRRADRRLGTQMKATGEVMAIDRSFPAALQKAVRALEIDAKDLGWEDPLWSNQATLWRDIEIATDLRLWAVATALRRGVSVEEIAERSSIDRWFVSQMSCIVAFEDMLQSPELHDRVLWQAKRLGYSDKRIAVLQGVEETIIRERRYAAGMLPVFKMVDTCAAEFEAITPYYYSCYDEENEAEPLVGEKVVVIGSGPIRIGQGIEFDYCSVQAAHALNAAGVQSILINSNPETVSTDFDTSDRLYFESLDEESVAEILRHEGVGRMDQVPLVLQFGGQTAINLAEPLFERGAPVLGSSVDTIDLAEDRERFEAFLQRIGIPQPPGVAVTRLDQAAAAAEQIGYPVLVRPSYVLGGRAMEVVHSVDQLNRYLLASTDFSADQPILIDSYFAGKEVEVDAITDGTDVLIPGIMEHIERAGVHSGDSFAVYPGVNLYPKEVERLVEYTTRIALELGAVGMINIQYVIHRGRIYVLEVNPRSSRTVPFLSKVTGVPMVEIATKAMLGMSIRDQGYEPGLWPRQPLVAVKAPVFSMAKLRGVEVNLGPEMKSTGEAMGIDREFAPAFYKSLMASGLSMSPRSSVLVSLADQDKAEAIEMIETLVRIGCEVFATEGTAAMIEREGMPVQMVTKRIGKGRPDVIDVILEGTVQAVINTPGMSEKEVLDGFQIRRAAVEKGISCITSIDTARAVVQAMSLASGAYTVQPLPLYRKRVSVGY